MQLAFDLIQIAFAFAFGACVGSLVNVLVYRLPLGLSVVTPPSACPRCATRLTWRENIPVVGWLLLRGRCRFCRSPISGEYPGVEAFVGVGFALFYLMLFGDTWRWVGFAAFPRPEWAINGLALMWPTMVIWLVLFGALVAMTLVDAKTCQIPLVLTWVPAAVGAVGHTAHAAYLQHQDQATAWAPGWWWAIATPGPASWWWIGAGLGGIVGVGLSSTMVWLGVMRQSFADYDEWERAQLAAEAVAASPQVDPPQQGSTDSGAPPPAPGATPIQDAAATPGLDENPTHTPANVERPDGMPTDLWTAYPHARREMIRELIFLAPIVGLALIGGWVASRLAGPWVYNPGTLTLEPASLAPLWLMVLSGSCLGYLIGGGVVWLMRILGTLGVGREAMGLGDVHMMAAVGACLGWIDAVLGFFGAAFVGLAWALVSALARGRLRRAMPYGPFLAIATVLVLWTKPWIERALTALLGHTLGSVDLP